MLFHNPSLPFGPQAEQERYYLYGGPQAYAPVLPYLAPYPAQEFGYLGTTVGLPPASPLEGLVEAPGAETFVSGLISDKSRFAQLAVKNLQGLIDERIRLRELNTERIDYDMCKAKSQIYQLELWGYRGGFDRQRQTLGLTLFGLERERRGEEVSCWRDVSRLKLEMAGAMAEHASAARRETLFREPEERGGASWR